MKTMLLVSTLALAASPAHALFSQSTAAPWISSPDLRPSETGVLLASAPLGELPAPANLFALSGIVSAVFAPCPVAQAQGAGQGDAPAARPDQTSDRCIETLDPYRRFLDTTVPVALSSKQKGYLAIRNTVDPGNLATIIGTSAFTIGTDAHTAYGPGWHGFGRNAGTSLLQDTTGEFFGTFLIPSLTLEDPHYHRMPRASIARRVLHAVSRTVIAQHDDGSPMLNYATLLTYPISAEISNLYVPGIQGDGPSTVARILTGYATDPIDNLITEFLPDFARRIHVRVIFVQRILNQVSSDPNSVP